MLMIVPDATLKTVVRANFEAHPPQNQINFFHPAEGTNFVQQISSQTSEASFVVVGVTGQHPNEFWALEAAAEHEKPYGLILQTEDVRVWAMMSLTHRLKPFAFVIALGKGPRKANTFFKNARFFNIHQPEHYRLRELMCRL